MHTTRADALDEKRAMLEWMKSYAPDQHRHRVRVLAAGFLVAGALLAPSLAPAQAAVKEEMQAQMISLLSRIVSLQKQLIDALHVQVAELRQELSGTCLMTTASNAPSVPAQTSDLNSWTSPVDELMRAVGQINPAQSDNLQGTSSHAGLNGPFSGPIASQLAASTTPIGKGGCWMAGTWYPEGAQYPPQRPGMITGSIAVYLCQNGKWIMQQ